MLKLIFNEDFSHAVMSDNFSQSTILEVANYSTRSINMNFNITATSIPNLLAFENTKITSLRIQEENGNEVVRFNFGTSNIYILNYNTNIYNNGQNTNVSMGQVNIIEPEEPEEPESEGEGE